MAEDGPPGDADGDDGLAAVEEATRRAERAWRWVALGAVILVVHVGTGGWPWLTIVWAVLLLLRVRDAVRARRAEQAALRDWTPPGPWQRGR